MVPVAVVGPLACAAVAIYVGLVLQADRRERGTSRVSAYWLAAAALVPTLGIAGVSSLVSLAVPLWVLWRCRGEDSQTMARAGGTTPASP